MGVSVLGFIVCISLLLQNFSVLAQLISTTLHSTHPQVTYAPESCCARNFFRRCVKRYDPFTMSTYVGPNGQWRTFFQTSTWGNEPNSWNMKRRVEVKFYGRAVYVYGPPQAQLDNRLGTIQITLDGVFMETIDLETKYRESNDEPWNPQLMYYWEWGNGDAAHVLEISLLDYARRGQPIRGFGFDSIVYTSMEPWRPPKYELSSSEKLDNVKIHDTNFVTSFSPASAWRKTVSDISSSEGIRTFHRTSNELVDRSWYDVTPVATFTVQCAALAVYGASPAQLQATFPGGFRHGHLQICRWRNCEYIDAHQAYLNVPWNEPVLLYSTDRMSPHVSETVTMRLLDPSSPVGHLWTMTFSHAVCSRVVRKWPWTHPIPDGNYSSTLVQHHELDYGPAFLPSFLTSWSRTDLYSSAVAEPWFLGLFGMPGWSTTVRGHDIQIFVPFPSQFPAFQYANVRCCIDGRCHYPDIEQWFLKTRDAQSDVPLVHYQDLNPFRDHHISMTAVRRGDEVGEKVTAVSRIVSQGVAVACPPSSDPSKTPDCLSWPGLEQPTEDDHGFLVGLGLTALLVVIILARWCFVGISIDSQRQQAEKQYLLPPPGSCQQSPQGDQPVIGKSYSSCETDYTRKAKLAVDPSSGPLGYGSDSVPTPGDHSKRGSHFSPKIYRCGHESALNGSSDLSSEPVNLQPCAPGPSNAGCNSNPEPPLTSWNRADRGSESFITDGIANTTPHQDQRPFLPKDTDGGLGAVTRNGDPSMTVQSSSARLPSGALGLAMRDPQPPSSPHSVSETLPPYSDPPSYPASVVTVIASPPRPHGAIGMPRPAPSFQEELRAPSNTTLRQFEGSSGLRRPQGRMQDHLSEPHSPQPTVRSTRERRRPRPHQHPSGDMTDPPLAAVEETDANMAEGEEGGSGRRRGRRGRRGRRSRRETAEAIIQDIAVLTRYILLDLSLLCFGSAWLIAPARSVGHFVYAPKARSMHQHWVRNDPGVSHLNLPEGPFISFVGNWLVARHASSRTWPALWI